MHTLLHKLHARKGFTLLELLVVISIIGVLIGLASVSFTTAQRKARNAKRRADIKAVQNAFEQYYAGSNAYSTNCTTMASASMSQGVPTDPKNGASYDLTCSTTSAYCICAALESETGNAGAACDYSAGTKLYYCLTNLQ